MAAFHSARLPSVQGQTAVRVRAEKSVPARKATRSQTKPGS